MALRSWAMLGRGVVLWSSHTMLGESWVLKGRALLGTGGLKGRCAMGRGAVLNGPCVLQWCQTILRACWC